MPKVPLVCLIVNGVAATSPLFFSPTFPDAINEMLVPSTLAFVLSVALFKISKGVVPLVFVTVFEP